MAERSLSQSADSGSDRPRVCAIVITYNPEAELLGNLERLRRQVSCVVIVDNGSGAEAERILSEAQAGPGCMVLRQEQNLGIAAALNIGVQWAMGAGLEWVALFDQDSTVTENFISSLFKQYESAPERERVGMLAPRYRDRHTGEYARVPRLAADGAPLEIMTSGSLIPARVFERCGLFREDFFIDQVDHEFSFRLRDYGLQVLVCPDAVLLHAPGQPRQHRLGRIGSFHSSHHRAGRRYYMTRNSLVMVRQYWRAYPGWAWHTLRSILIAIPIKVLLGEEDRWNKLRLIARGVADAQRGRLGKRVEL